MLKSTITRTAANTITSTDTGGSADAQPDLDHEPPVTRNSRAWKPLLRLVVVLALSLAGLLGLAGQAAASTPVTYASGTYNGMWHMGTVQYYNGNRNFDFTVRFNDVPGDVYCTQLRDRVYLSDGSSALYNAGSVCGGGAGTLTRYVTAYYPSTITKVEIWTVRADGAIRSYLWYFKP